MLSQAAMSPHILLVLLALVASQALGAPPGEKAESYEDRLSRLEKLYEVQTGMLQKQHLVIEDQQQQIDKQHQVSEVQQQQIVEQNQLSEVQQQQIDKQNQVSEIQQQQIDKQHQVSEIQQQQIDKQNQHILDLEQQVMTLNKEVMDQKEENQDHRLVTHHLKTEIDTQKEDIVIRRQQIEKERCEFVTEELKTLTEKLEQSHKKEIQENKELLEEVNTASIRAGVVAFYVYRTSDFTAGPSNTDIPFDNQQVNIGGGFIDDTFTAPVSGIYVFYLQISVDAGLYSRAYVRLNNASNMAGIACNNEGGISFALTCSHSMILDLIQGDRLSASLTANQSVYSGGNKFTTFSGYLLHEIL